MDSDIVRLLLALLLVLLNGFFVAAEFSIVKVRYSQIQLKAAEGTQWQSRQSISSNILMNIFLQHN
jgi:CBS domain containing-hemolysin-like protein